MAEHVEWLYEGNLKRDMAMYFGVLPSEEASWGIFSRWSTSCQRVNLNVQRLDLKSSTMHRESRTAYILGYRGTTGARGAEAEVTSTCARGRRWGLLGLCSSYVGMIPSATSVVPRKMHTQSCKSGEIGPVSPSDRPYTISAVPPSNRYTLE